MQRYVVRTAIFAALVAGGAPTACVAPSESAADSAALTPASDASSAPPSQLDAGDGAVDMGAGLPRQIASGERARVVAIAKDGTAIVVDHDAGKVVAVDPLTGVAMVLGTFTSEAGVYPVRHTDWYSVDSDDGTVSVWRPGDKPRRICKTVDADVGHSTVHIAPDNDRFVCVRSPNFGGGAGPSVVSAGRLSQAIPSRELVFIENEPTHGMGFHVAFTDAGLVLVSTLGTYSFFDLTWKPTGEIQKDWRSSLWQVGAMAVIRDGEGLRKADAKTGTLSVIDANVTFEVSSYFDEPPYYFGAGTKIRRLDATGRYAEVGEVVPDFLPRAVSPDGRFVVGDGNGSVTLVQTFDTARNGVLLGTVPGAFSDVTFGTGNDLVVRTGMSDDATLVHVTTSPFVAKAFANVVADWAYAGRLDWVVVDKATKQVMVVSPLLPPVKITDAFLLDADRYFTLAARDGRVVYKIAQPPARAGLYATDIAHLRAP